MFLLSWFAKRGGNVVAPSQRYIAEACGVSVRTVIRAVELLRRLGYLIASRKSFAGTLVYHFRKLLTDRVARLFESAAPISDIWADNKAKTKVKKSNSSWLHSGDAEQAAIIKRQIAELRKETAQNA